MKLRHICFILHYINNVLLLANANAIIKLTYANNYNNPQRVLLIDNLDFINKITISDCAPKSGLSYFSLIRDFNLVYLSFNLTNSNQSSYLLKLSKLNEDLYFNISIQAKSLSLSNLNELKYANKLTYKTSSNESLNLNELKQSLIQSPSENSSNLCTVQVDARYSIRPALFYSTQVCLHSPVSKASTPNEEAISFNLEYIFKLNNESTYGLIKDDMTSNGIVAIIKLVEASGSNLALDVDKRFEIRLGANNTFFQIKKFLPKFYMLRLTNLKDELFKMVKLNSFAEIELGAYLDSSLIASTKLKFKLVSSKSLQIKFESDSIEMSISEDYGKAPQSNPYGGLYIHKFSSVLSQDVFENVEMMNEYKFNNIRFAIVNTTYSNLFELDTIKGHLSIQPKQTIDREALAELVKPDEDGKVRLLLNISAVDARKLFKTAYATLSLNILDLNDNKPEFKSEKYFIEIDENEMSKVEDKYVLVFNEKAVDLDAGENSSLNYDLLSATSDLNLFFVEKSNGKIWMSSQIFNRGLNSSRIDAYKLFVMCKDNGRPYFKYTTIELNIKLNLYAYDRFEKFDLDSAPPQHSSIGMFLDQQMQDVYLFEFDMSRLTHLGQLNLGKLPIRFANTTQIVPSSASPTNKFDLYSSLAIQNDGGLILYLKASLRDEFDFSFVEKKFSMIVNENQYKTVKIYLRPLARANEPFKFDKSLAEFNINEDVSNDYYSIRQNKKYKRSIGVLNTSCKTNSYIQAKLVDFELANLNGLKLDDLFQLELDENESSLNLIAVENLDYEFEANYEFHVLAKCRLNQNWNNTIDYLISTRVRVNLIDLNDNKPRFTNPVASNQLVYKKLNMDQDREEAELHLLTTLSAFDIDRSAKYSTIKYLIQENSLKTQSSCDKLKLSLFVNETNGELYFKIETSDSSMSRCLIEYDLKAIAYNYLDKSSDVSESVRFKLVVDLRNMNNFPLTIKQLEFIDANSTNSIRVNYDSNKIMDLMSIQECTVNHIPSFMFYYFSLSNGLFYFHHRIENSFDKLKIECKLVETGLNVNGFDDRSDKIYMWLELELHNSKMNSELNLKSTETHIDITYDRKMLLQPNLTLTKIDQVYDLGLNGHLILHELSKSNLNFVKNLFAIDQLSGVLSTTSIELSKDDHNEYFKILNSIDFVKLDLNMFVYDTKTTKSRQFEYSVYLHLAKESPNNINDNMNMQKLNSIWHELNGKLFKRAVNYLNETLELYVLKLYEPLEDTHNDISFELVEVNEIDLSSESNSKKQTSADLFSIVKVESVFNLKLSVKENEPIDSNLYLIEVNICLKTFSVFENQENANTFVKNCRMASFNLKINFKLDLFELRFSKNEYQINLIQFEGNFYNEQLNSLSPIKPIVDLKEMIQNRNLFNLDKLIQSALVEFNFEPSINQNELVISSNPNNNSLFYLDKVNGNVYAASLEEIFATKLNSYEIEVYLKHSSLVQSKAVIKFAKIKQPKELNSSIVIKINEDAETGRILWTNLMKLNLSIQLNENSKIELNCFDLEQFVCNNLFKLNPKSDYLMVNKNYAVDYLFKANLNTIKQFKVRLQLAIANNQMSRIEFDVNVDLDFNYFKRREIFILLLYQFLWRKTCCVEVSK